MPSLLSPITVAKIIVRPCENRCVEQTVEQIAVFQSRICILCFDLLVLDYEKQPRIYSDDSAVNVCGYYIDVLVQDCSISNALAMEILQFCTEPSIYPLFVNIPISVGVLN